MAVDPGYLEDASGFRGYAERLFRPESGGELAGILGEAARRGTPVTVFGAGTGLTGGAVARGGWVLSTERLSGLAIEPGLARAGAGVRLAELQSAASRAGQFYPPDPTEWAASVGGTIATNASGSRSFRYGATRRFVEALDVALMDGRLRHFRRGEPIDFDVPPVSLPAVAKNTAGFHLRPAMDWVDLLVGSEGVLGVVTGAELRLLPEARALIAGVVFLPDDAAAVGAVDAWRLVGGLRMMEYFDRGSLDLLRARHPDIPSGTGAALLIEQECDDPGEEVDLWVERLEAVGGDTERSWFTEAGAGRERFRRFRHGLPEAVNDIVRRRGLMKLGSDYAVPLACNAAMLAIYRERLEAEFAGRFVIFGHIGDAHVHVNLLPESAAQFERGRELMLELAREAVRLGGTVSAEHGLGKRKAELLRIQYGDSEIEAMRQVKRRLDPGWLLGRGTLFVCSDEPSL